MSPTPILVAIVGPTASGKSSLAIRAALKFSGEIINCDSMQMVRGLDIGTAKPTAKERQIVPHHLFDTVEPTQLYSAGRYMQEARQAAREISERGHTPFVVGGTGLYLRAMLEGLFEGPGRSDQIREVLNVVAHRQGRGYLYSVLGLLDPECAARIHETDAVRVSRALEAMIAGGRRMSELQEETLPISEFRVFKVALSPPRDVLYNRIDQRVISMFASGLVDEVESLLESGVSSDCKGFEALGYRHVVALLAGQLTRTEAIELTQRDSRRYAKRQLTWFRRETEVVWIEAAGESDEAWSSFLDAFRRFRESVSCL